MAFPAEPPIPQRYNMNKQVVVRCLNEKVSSKFQVPFSLMEKLWWLGDLHIRQGDHLTHALSQNLISSMEWFLQVLGGMMWSIKLVLDSKLKSYALSSSLKFFSLFFLTSLTSLNNNCLTTPTYTPQTSTLSIQQAYQNYF